VAKWEHEFDQERATSALNGEVPVRLAEIVVTK
jgi:hypothetical protein